MAYYSRRNPWPFHMLLNNTGLLLGQTKPGAPQLVSSKMQDINQVAPPDYSYGGTNPISDRQEPYESLGMGMGLHMQEKWQDYRYASAEAVDLSVWPWCKGPLLHSYVPSTRDSIAGIRTFFELNGVLYAANGRYVLQKSVSDTWAVVQDFGASASILNVTVFTSNFDGLQRAFFALSAGPAQWTADGTTYTAMATFQSLAFLAIGREFWWADDVNRLRKCDTNADPTVEDNYTSLIFRAGDKLASITNLVTTSAGTMLILKTDGVYTLDASGDDHALFPFLKYARRPDNGRWTGQYENSVYVSYGKTFMRLNQDLSLEEIGPEKLMANDSPVRGQVTAFTGIGDMFAMGGIYNPDTQTSYLMKFGGFVNPTTVSQYSSASPSGARVDVWHGSLCHGLHNVVIQALFESYVDAPSGHTRTWMGLSDGSLAYLINPCVPNPAVCTAYLFDVGDGWVDLPIGTAATTPRSRASGDWPSRASSWMPATSSAWTTSWIRHWRPGPHWPTSSTRRSTKRRRCRPTPVPCWQRSGCTCRTSRRRPARWCLRLLLATRCGRVGS